MEQVGQEFKWCIEKPSKSKSIIGQHLGHAHMVGKEWRYLRTYQNKKQCGGHYE